MLIGIPGKFGPQKTRIMGLPGSEDFDDRLSCFDTIPAYDGQTDWRTDRQTDRRPAYINNVRSMNTFMNTFICQWRQQRTTYIIYEHTNVKDRQMTELYREEDKLLTD